MKRINMTTRRRSLIALAGAVLLSGLPSPAAAADEPSSPKARDRRVYVVDDAGAGSPQRRYRELVQMMRGAYLGIQAVDLTGELRSHFGAPDDAGVLVGRVEDDSPAAQAGLKVGDLITRVDGEDVDSGMSIRRALQDNDDGDSVEMEILRDGRPMTLTATVKAREHARVDMGPLLRSHRLLRQHADGDDDGDDDVQVVIPEIEIPEIRIPRVALEDLDETLNSPEFRERLKAAGRDDAALRARLKALETRLKELERRLQESEK